MHAEDAAHGGDAVTAPEPTIEQQDARTFAIAEALRVCRTCDVEPAFNVRDLMLLAEYLMDGTIPPEPNRA